MEACDAAHDRKSICNQVRTRNGSLNSLLSPTYLFIYAKRLMLKGQPMDKK